MAKVDFSQLIYGLSGQVLKGETKDTDLAWICVEALLAANPREEVEGNEKVQRYDIALRIRNGGKVELNAEDLAKVKACVGKWGPPLLVGQAWALLEGKKNPLATPPSKKEKTDDEEEEEPHGNGQAKPTELVKTK